MRDRGNTTPGLGVAVRRREWIILIGSVYATLFVAASISIAYSPGPRNDPATSILVSLLVLSGLVWLIYVARGGDDS